MVIPSWVYLALGLSLGALPTRWYYQAEQARDMANVANGMKAMSEAYRAREHEQQASVETIRIEARQNEQNTRDDGYAAGVAAERLRLAAKGTAARATCPTGTAIGSQATQSPSNMLADVLARLDEATGELARAADERGNAGEACWRTLNARGQK